MTSLVDTTAWLVGIPSETGAEAGLRDAIADRLAAFDQIRVGNSLIVGEPGPGKRILVGHLDTVPLQGELGPMVDDDRIYGLGATDMKAGMAVMIHLLEALRTPNLVGVFYAGEEGPLSGNDLGLILDEVVWMSEADAAFVMEPTDRQVQAGCNGAINATVTFDGVAAHSARPWLGENAVTKAGHFLEEMHDRPPEEHMVSGLAFKEVLSVTRAAGGVANNIIPSQFLLNVNYRFAPHRDPEEATALLAEICSDADGFAVADWAPAGSVDVDHPLFAALIESSGGEVVGKQGWTDVAQLSRAGIPAINFGPGEAALAHKPGESVRISDLDWAYEAMMAVLG